MISSLVKRYNSILDNKNIVKLLNYGSIALVLDYTILTINLGRESIFTNPTNPLLWKVLNETGEHHVLTLLAVWFLYSYLCYHIHKIKFRLYGIISFYFMYSVISWHELLWWFSYAISHIIYHIPFQMTWITYGAFWMGDLIVVLSFIYFYKRTRHGTLIRFNFPRIYIVVLVCIYIFWILIRFPITIDYTGKTAWYFNDYVNFYEIVSWISSVLVFGVEFQVINPSGEKKLTEESKEIHSISLTSINI